MRVPLLRLFQDAVPGNGAFMLGLALALLVVGLVVGFLVPPFGFVPAALGLILLVAFLLGFGRRAREGQP